MDSWYNISDKIRERHRNDLLQVLAYASLPESKEISCCLMYPCKQKTWDSLVERGRHIHSAEMNRGDRRIRLHLSAIPFSLKSRELSELQTLLRVSDN